MGSSYLRRGSRSIRRLAKPPAPDSAALAPVLAQWLDRAGAPVIDLDTPGRPLEVRLDPRYRLLLWRPEYGPRPGS
jgi:hypothetical protein